MQPRREPSRQFPCDTMPSNRQTARGGQRILRSEASPCQLENQGINRYSYAETPIEMQRPKFHPLSSPTNSTIEESPMSPVSGQDLRLHPLPYVDSTYPVEKATVNRTSPYNFPPPSEPHPAQFAPYAEDRGLPQWHEPRSGAQPPQSPGPIPIKTQVEMAGSEPNAPTGATAIEPEVDRRGSRVYNPDSLSGPNGAPEAHRPGQVSHPNAAVDPEWKHGLCEIDTTCCLGIWCPCMVYGKTQYRLSQKAQKQDATDLLSYEPCNGSCGIMALACGLQCKT